jgi:curli production assembly/transport component CsgF
MKFYRTVLLLTLGAMTGGAGWASELTYMPVNPTFGGNPSNQAGLMSVATAQNNYKAPTVAKVVQTPLEKFAQNLQTLLTNKLTSAISTGLFKEDGTPILDKPFTAGQFQVQFGTDATDSGILSITVTDTKNGGTQTIQVGNLDAFAAAGQ